MRSHRHTYAKDSIPVAGTAELRGGKNKRFGHLGKTKDLAALLGHLGKIKDLRAIRDGRLGALLIEHF